MATNKSNSNSSTATSVNEEEEDDVRGSVRVVAWDEVGAGVKEETSQGHYPKV